MYEGSEVHPYYRTAQDLDQMAYVRSDPGLWALYQAGYQRGLEDGDAAGYERADGEWTDWWEGRVQSVREAVRAGEAYRHQERLMAEREPTTLTMGDVAESWGLPRPERDFPLEHGSAWLDQQTHDEQHEDAAGSAA